MLSANDTITFQGKVETYQDLLVPLRNDKLICAVGSAETLYHPQRWLMGVQESVQSIDGDLMKHSNHGVWKLHICLLVSIRWGVSGEVDDVRVVGCSVRWKSRVMIRELHCV
jgi:hypothetical protein